MRSTTRAARGYGTTRLLWTSYFSRCQFPHEWRRPRGTRRRPIVAVSIAIAATATLAIGLTHLLQAPFKELKSAIPLKGVTAFTKAYADLTDAYNSRHQALNHGVAEIDVSNRTSASSLKTNRRPRNCPRHPYRLNPRDILNANLMAHDIRELIIRVPQSIWIGEVTCFRDGMYCPCLLQAL
jgi:hypothetical protein